MSISKRAWLVGGAVWLVVLVVAGWIWWARDHAAVTPVYQGVDLGGQPAPAFTLTDQTGAAVSLAGLQGKSILLTFLDGHCKDVCPETLAKMADVEALLGPRAQQVAIVAISVDPWLDQVGKPAAIAENGAPQPKSWHFLTGTHEQLKPVWQAYHVAVVEEKVGQFSVNGAHDTGFFLIDAQGKERRYISSQSPARQVVGLLRRIGPS
ncbi:MAG TPA: SCO family protein [Limnochordia bacterium]|nr:SCO family protein [Limnochordia bacterium]